MHSNRRLIHLLITIATCCYSAAPAASGTKNSTYLGGAADDQANGITVDLLGNAYVAGSTQSGNFDVFVTGDWNNSGSAKAGVFRGGAVGVQPFQWVLDANGLHTPDIVFNL